MMNLGEIKIDELFEYVSKMGEIPQDHPFMVLEKYKDIKIKDLTMEKIYELTQAFDFCLELLAELEIHLRGKNNEK